MTDQPLNHTPKDVSSSYILKRLWHSYIKPYTPRILLSFVFMILCAITTATLAKMMEPVIDDVFKNEDIMQLQWVVGVVFIAFLVKGIATYGEEVSMNFVGQSVISDLQKTLFSKIIQADISFFYQQSTGSLVSLCTYNITLIRNMIENTLKSLGKDIFTVIFLMIVMFYQDPLLSCIALFVFPLALIPLIKVGKKMRHVSKNTQDKTGTWASFLTQALQGIRLIKSYNMEKKEIDYGVSYIDQLLSLSLRSGRIKSLSSPIMETIGGGAIVIVIGYGGFQVIEGHNTAGAFFSFITALIMMYEPAKRLAKLHANLQEGLAATAQIFDIIDVKPTIKSPINAQPLDIKNTTITFENVGFAYDKEHPVVKNISINIAPGEKVALIGPSGAGKTTLFNLMLRFFDTAHGKILIDGQDIRQVTLPSLRKMIGFVSQEIVLFNMTIRENILFGKPDASEEDVIIAAKNAAAHTFIKSLPHGYDTIVGESGLKLSGGQRQRISLARAFLKNAPILLLDEATSALDTKSEKVIQASLDKLMIGKTCLIIAHRLSTIQNVDKIYVMSNGEIIENGTHEALLKNKSLYYQLNQQQVKTHAEMPS